MEHIQFYREYICVNERGGVQKSTGIIKNLQHIDIKKFFDDARDLFTVEIRKLWMKISLSVCSIRRIICARKG